MAEKISINIEIPGLNLFHNYFVPEDMNVSKMLELVIKTLSDEYFGTRTTNLKAHMLIQASTGLVVDNGCSLKQIDTADGEKFILI